MTDVHLRLLGVACAALLLAGCGGRSEETSTAWQRVRGCLADKGAVELDGIPPTGSYPAPDVSPLNFGDAPGGWLIADMGRGQRLSVFFYDDAADAKRADEAAGSADTRPRGTMGKAIYVFDEQPTSEESALLESCLVANAGS